MISQFFVISPRGDTLIFKDYRGDVPRTTSEKFWRHVKFSKGEAPPVFVRDLSLPFAREPRSLHLPGKPRSLFAREAPLSVCPEASLVPAICPGSPALPCVMGSRRAAQCIEGVNYMYVKKSGLYLCITSRYNLSPCMILELLERLTRYGPPPPRLGPVLCTHRRGARVQADQGLLRHDQRGHRAEKLRADLRAAA